MSDPRTLPPKKRFGTAFGKWNGENGDEDGTEPKSKERLKTENSQNDEFKSANRNHQGWSGLGIKH